MTAWMQTERKWYFCSCEHGIFNDPNDLSMILVTVRSVHSTECLLRTIY